MTNHKIIHQLMQKQAYIEQLERENSLLKEMMIKKISCETQNDWENFCRTNGIDPTLKD